MALEQPLRSGDIGIGVAAWLRPARDHGVINQRAVDPLQRQLAPKRALAPWPRPVARLHPGGREGFVIENAQLHESIDRATDQVFPVARCRKAPTHLGDGSLARLEKPQRRLEDEVRIVDRRSPRATVRKRLTPLPWPGRPVAPVEFHSGWP